MAIDIPPRHDQTRKTVLDAVQIGDEHLPADALPHAFPQRQAHGLCGWQEGQINGGEKQSIKPFRGSQRQHRVRTFHAGIDQRGILRVAAQLTIAIQRDQDIEVSVEYQHVMERLAQRLPRQPLKGRAIHAGFGQFQLVVIEPCACIS